MKIPKKLKNSVEAMLAIQGADGNYNYCSYMHGMYNGMEMIWAMMEDRDPVFKKAPDKWLEDEPNNKVLEDEQDV